MSDTKRAVEHLEAKGFTDSDFMDSGMIDFISKVMTDFAALRIAECIKLDKDEIEFEDDDRGHFRRGINYVINHIKSKLKDNE